MRLRQNKVKRLSRKVQRGSKDFIKEHRNIVGASLAVIGAAGAVGLYQVERRAINGWARKVGRLLRQKQ